ncbi:MAG: protein kinase [Bryobacteraceae bacterium]|jgi:Tol biopolymer transport system component
MPLSANTKLGVYEILAPLGAGGMGEVYRARDTKLDREVAIKILPAAVSGDPERLARFEREAKVLASLNHPNIAQIYGFEESDNGCALIMELVPGQTLKGPLPIDTALKYAQQIADALEAAHEKGIVHRDLKPANIMITPAGVVKVLDFGLAAQTRDNSSASAENSPTFTINATQAGVILGTAAYMSPEQARGEPVDKRTDIWAFGVVLFEMLTGQRLHQGKTVSDVLASVLKEEPDLNAVPAKVRRLAAKCLEKDPRKRLRDIGDWEALIVDELPAFASRSRLGMRAGWALAAVSILALAALAFVHFRETPPAVPLLNLSAPLPANATPGAIALSPDGKRLVIQISAENTIQLWLRSLDSLQFQPLPGTDFAFAPFWSPDSKSIGFFAAGKLKTISAAGGPPQALCAETGTSGGGGTWSRDGVILFGSAAGPLRRVNASGGPCTAVTRPEGTSSHLAPDFLPDGKHFVFEVRGADESKQGIYLASLDNPAPRRLFADVSSALFAPSTLGKEYGYLLFLRGNNLMAQPFNPRTLQFAGEVFPTGAEASFSSVRASLLASVSTGGMLAYCNTGGRASAQLTWLDRSGKELGTVGSIVQSETHVALSPDGKTAATRRNQEIWLYDLQRGNESLLTAPDLNASQPVWSPDGNLVAFGAGKGLYVKDARGGLKEELLFEDANTKRPSDWSRDGHFLIYTATEATDSNTYGTIWYLPDPLDKPGKGQPVQFAGAEQGGSQGQLSPDGRWLAYSGLGATSGTDVYVRPFPSGPGRWKISAGARINVEPRWRRDGRELFYLEGLSPVQQLMAVSVQAGPRGDFEAGVPRALFEFGGSSYVPNLNIFSYDPSADGQRFLVFRRSGDRQPVVNVISNWEKFALGNK